MSSPDFRNSLEEKIKKSAEAAVSIQRLARKKECRIAISTITVAEYLAGIDESKKLKALRGLERNYTIAAFNNKAAVDAGRIFIYGKKNANRSCYSRTVISADSKVIASLKAMRCSFFVSHDAEAVKLANAFGFTAYLPEEVDTKSQYEFPFDDRETIS
jgi:predicted nucleic acid-binding protein